MTEAGHTLKDFFFGEEGHSEAQWILPAIQRTLCGSPDFSWPVETATIAEKLGEALEVRFADILAGAWGERPEIRYAMKQSLHLPGEALHVPLAGHRLTSAHEPSVELVADGKVVRSLTFGLEVSLQTEDAVLTIRDGRVDAVSAGTGLGAGQLDQDGTVLIERYSQKFDLAGKVSRDEDETVVGPRPFSAEAA